MDQIILVQAINCKRILNYLVVCYSSFCKLRVYVLESVMADWTKRLKRTISTCGDSLVPTSELDFHIWNASWPIQYEAKMAAHRGQFCTSVLVPYAGLHVSFSLPCDFLLFLKIFLIENTYKTCLQKTKVNLRISNIFRQSQTEL